MSAALRKVFEEYKHRADVWLWLTHSTRHAFRLWSDGYGYGFRAAQAAQSPSQPLVEVQEPATEAEVRAVMGKAGFDPSATSWSGGIEEMQHVIAAAAPVRGLPLTEERIQTFGDAIDRSGAAWPYFLSAQEKRVQLVRHVESHHGIGSPAPGGDGEGQHVHP